MLTYEPITNISKKIFIFLILSFFFFISFFIYFQRNDNRGDVDVILDLNIDFNQDFLQKYQKEIIGYVKTYFKNTYQAKNLQSDNHLGNFKFTLNTNDIDKDKFIAWLDYELINLLSKQNNNLIFINMLIDKIKSDTSDQIALNDLILQLDSSTFNSLSPTIQNKFFKFQKKAYIDCTHIITHYSFVFDNVVFDECHDLYQNNLKILQEIKSNIILTNSNFIDSLNYLTKFQTIIQKTNTKKVIIRSIIASMILTLIFSLMLLSIIKFFKKND